VLQQPQQMRAAQPRPKYDDKRKDVIALLNDLQVLWGVGKFIKSFDHGEKKAWNILPLSYTRRDPYFSKEVCARARVRPCIHPAHLTGCVCLCLCLCMCLVSCVCVCARAHPSVILLFPHIRTRPCHTHTHTHTHTHIHSHSHSHTHRLTTSSARVPSELSRMG
jgi:hypothetical protein